MKSRNVELRAARESCRAIGLDGAKVLRLERALRVIEDLREPVMAIGRRLSEHEGGKADFFGGSLEDVTRTLKAISDAWTYGEDLP